MCQDPPHIFDMHLPPAERVASRYRIIAELAGLAPLGAGPDGALRFDDPRWKGYLANLTPEELDALRQAADAVYVDQKVKEYLLDVIRATRQPGEYGLDLGGLIQLGGSTRAVIALLRAVKAHAFLAGRGYVTPEDVKTAAPDVLRHRLVISFEAEAEDLRPEALVKQVLDRLPVP